MLPVILPDRGRQGRGSGGGKRRIGPRAGAAAVVTALACVMLIAVGCRATAPPAAVAGAASAAPASELSFQADLAPVSALAFTDPFLWIGSARGLRRFRLPAGP